MCQPGANGREMYVVLEETSDEQHVRVKVANQTSDYALPLLLRSNGGLGAAGGNGGPGGTFFGLISVFIIQVLNGHRWKTDTRI